MYGPFFLTYLQRQARVTRGLGSPQVTPRPDDTADNALKP